MKTLTEIISEYEAAEARFEPFRTALREQLQTAIDTYKRVGREHGLYSNWDYGWTHWMGWINLSDIEIQSSGIYIEYDRGEHGSGEAVLSFDEISNAADFATGAAERAKAQRVSDAQADKEAKRRSLERQLAELDR